MALQLEAVTTAADFADSAIEPTGCTTGPKVLDFGAGVVIETFAGIILMSACKRWTTFMWQGNVHNLRMRMPLWQGNQQRVLNARGSPHMHVYVAQSLMKMATKSSILNPLRSLLNLLYNDHWSI
ncbi:hypothetical protein CTI12_AA268720 [Artemisia annua]|uniref:Uncharacterized protein n=1 Tax=Artemisia annua TaxID=35608 RepID=A0A2U1NGH6_ARTAN|nr:hypothetical protein CTI12_AA268720 [Artemisia annua]